METKNIHTHIDLTHLPKQNNGKIIWGKCVGLSIPFVYGTVSGIIEILDYKNNNEILFGYNGKQSWKSSTTITGKSIGGIIGKFNRDFLYNIGDIIQTNHSSLKVLDRRVKKRKEYYLKCLTCGDESWKTERAVITYKEYLCGVCAGNKLLVGYNDIATTDPWMIQFFQGREKEARQYTKSSNKRIYPICPDCGRIKNKSIVVSQIYRTHTIGCICGDSASYPERFIGAVLDQCAIDFETEFSPKWAKRKRYDFCIKNTNIIIEADGSRGHGTQNSCKSNQQIQKELDDDRLKEKLANDNGFIIYRVDCKDVSLEYLKENIMLSLSDIIELSNVDWRQCEIDATKNKVKCVCLEYENGGRNNFNELMNKYHISLSTLRRYLRKGDSYGWCYYEQKRR